MADFNKSTSPYKNTKVKDFYLDLYVDRKIPTKSDDYVITIEPKYHERPDSLSYDLYGTPNLWWIFARRNMDVIQDPIFDFTVGKVIYAPRNVEGLL